MGRTLERDWITAAGLRAVCVLVMRAGRRSHRCGYVEVPAGHPLYGVAYDQNCRALPGPAAEGEPVGNTPAAIIDVHGGLTYSGRGSEGYPAESSGWWFGFDCLHLGDTTIDPLPGLDYKTGEPRSEEYVVEECERLAAQIVSMFPPGSPSDDDA